MRAQFNHSDLIVSVLSVDGNMVTVIMGGETRVYSLRYLTIL